MGLVVGSVVGFVIGGMIMWAGMYSEIRRGSVPWAMFVEPEDRRSVDYK